MEDIASKRRDRVKLFKKIFLFVKIAAMAVASGFGSVNFVWSLYYNQERLNRYVPSVERCLAFCDEKKTLVISSVLCCIVACCFIAFLIFHGIEKIVVAIMMRKANTGR